MLARKSPDFSLGFSIGLLHHKPVPPSTDLLPRYVTNIAGAAIGTSQAIDPPVTIALEVEYQAAINPAVLKTWLLLLQLPIVSAVLFIPVHLAKSTSFC